MIVVKIGGASGIDVGPVLENIAGMDDVVLVHGGSGEVNDISTRLGKPPQTVISPSGHTSRRTDRETIDIFTMVLSGRINKMMVERLHGLGRNPIGLSGLDGRLLVGRRKTIVAVENGRKKVLRDDYTGRVEEVNSDLLQLLIDAGYLPVISPPALSTDNEAINVDGDRASAQIAGALGAEALVILSNIPGLLRDPDDPDSLVDSLGTEDREEALELAKGRMKRKVLAGYEALELGVKKVIIGDARRAEPVKDALDGRGTVIE